MNARWVVLPMMLAWTATAWSVERFPPPQFVETQHEMPSPQTPAATPTWQDWLDAGLLGAGLLLGAWLILRYRRRWAVLLLAAGALGYFGFVRRGCVCPVGAVQNVGQGLFAGSVVPWVVVAFFALPMLATLLFGRVFCGGLCPLGAIQDVVAFRPLKVPAAVEHAAGLLAWVVLAVAVALAATDSAYLICRYDPFVRVFRLSGAGLMVVFAAGMLLLGVFVARPYCRYLCPLGALFRPASRLSKHHATITPEECIRCRLCEDACPFGAIEPPMDPGDLPRRSGKARLGVLLLLGPALLAGGWYLGRAGGERLARLDRTVRLEQLVQQQEASHGSAVPDEVKVFQSSGESVDQLSTRAKAKRAEIVTAMGWAGLFVGLVAWLKLVSLNVRRTHGDYRPDRARCLSCGRCFEVCPMERTRRSEAGAA